MSRHVVVIGAGMAGLAAAERLVAGGVSVTVLERADRVGGRICTGSIGAQRVDLGPDAIRMTAQTDALLRRAGIGDHVVSPKASASYLLSRGRLRPLPAGLLGGDVRAVGQALTSGIVPLRPLLHGIGAACVPRRPSIRDETIRQRLGRRLGAGCVDALFAPLVAGIAAGSVDELSVERVLPAWSRLTEHPWLPAALLRSLGRPPSAPLLGLAGGLERLPQAVKRRLVDVGVDVRRRRPARTLVRRGSRAIVLTDVDAIDADGVVIACGSHAAAEILRAAAPAEAEALRSIDCTSVATVALAYDPDVVGRPLDASGFIAAAGHLRLVSSCSWMSAKWEHAAGPRAVLRASVRHRQAGDWPTDDALGSAVHDDLRRVMRLSGEPDAWLVAHHDRALGQPVPGNIQRLTNAAARLISSPAPVALAVGGLDGPGLAGAIAAGRRAARELEVAWAG